jgi:hypothetical protein
MLDPASVALKFGFLAVLFLFLLWVSRSALQDLRNGADLSERGRPLTPADATGIHAPGRGSGRVASADLDPRLIVERAPGTPRGWSTTSGRAP